MAHFLYISDVFCPWCYGFSGNISRIKKEFGLYFEVYGGALVEPPVNIAERMKQRPNVQGFIEKMYSVTGVRLSEKYTSMLVSENADHISMDSRKGSHLFYVMKHFCSDMALEIMEFLQEQFYCHGVDIFDSSVVEAFAEKFNVDAEDVFALLKEEKYEQLSYDETEKGFDILGEIVLYPTLYYVDDQGNRHFISRGYVEYEACKKTILNTMEAVKNSSNVSISALIGKSCTLDGKCE